MSSSNFSTLGRENPSSIVVVTVRITAPAEMANAIRNGKPNRASKEMAYHVLDIIDRMMESSEKGQLIRVESTCDRPAALTQAELDSLIRK